MMNRYEPIIIIEDDEDDQQLFKDAFFELGYRNQLYFFMDGQVALNFLNGEGKTLTPFLILSDINMPKLDGFALRDKIRMDAALQIRCIPYLYFSTSLNQNTVITAYEKSIQGFFVKQDTIKGLKEIISVIMEYWKHCASPNNFLPK
jgi:CheY-like chemotaxis protein